MYLFRWNYIPFYKFFYMCAAHCAHDQNSLFAIFGLWQYTMYVFHLIEIE